MTQLLMAMVFTLLPLFAVAGALPLEGHTSGAPLARHFDIFEDATGSMTLDQVRTPEVSARFKPSEKDAISFGFTPSAFWLRLTVTPPADGKQRASADDWLLDVAYAPIHYLELHVLQNGKVIESMYGGALVPFSERPYQHRTHVFPLPPLNGSVTELYLRVSGQSSKNVPASLWRARDFVNHAATHVYLLGAYFGVMIGLMFYNLFVFFSLRERAYGYYVAFLLASMTWTMTLNGLSSEWLWPGLGAVMSKAIPVLMTLTLFTGNLFAREFLTRQALTPKLNRIMTGFNVFYIAGLVLFPVLSYRILTTTITASGPLWAILMLVCGVYVLRQGHRSARYYLLAWMALLIGGSAMALKAFGVLPSNLMTEYGMQIGSALESILLSIALAAQMKILKDEKDKAQAEVLDQKQAALEESRQYSQRLESEVAARTADVVAMQEKLILQEKTSAMGVFSAGMAHEINNPANFISAGQQNLRAQLGEFKHYIDQLMDDDADADVVNSFHARFKRFDQSLDGIEEGVKRITSVVGRLRALNPEGQHESAPADLVEALQAAWDVVEPMAGGPVALETDWQCLDKVECRVAEIHQALVAVCSNAALALADLHSSLDAVFLPRVRLYTRREGDTLVLGVSDNGGGVPAGIADRIFDPFFTTRIVGQGTGLGLSTTRETLRRYHGDITLLRTTSQGATFEIRLPFSQPAKDQA